MELGPKMGHEISTCQMQMMQLTNKRIHKTEASYTLEGTVLQNVDCIKYLGVTITNDLKWNTHITNICTKANRTLGFLKRNLFSCPKDVKEAAYKGLVEYGSSIWDPHTKGLLEQLKWESLMKRRTDNRLILLYKGLKGKARIPTDDLIPKTRRCRNSQLPSASIEANR